MPWQLGYVTLTASATIHHANLTVARMLGIQRVRLVNSRLDLFVTEITRSRFQAFLDQIGRLG